MDSDANMDETRVGMQRVCVSNRMSSVRLCASEGQSLRARIFGTFVGDFSRGDGLPANATRSIDPLRLLRRESSPHDPVQLQGVRQGRSWNRTCD